MAMPIFQLKKKLVDPVDLHGVLHIRLGIHNRTFLSTDLTRLDQALILWGTVTGAIFLIAQSFPIDWRLQAVAWSVLSCVAIGVCGWLTWFWVITRNQRWILYGWSLLVLVGLGLTDYAIFGGSGLLLSHLCLIWLGISALGYVVTGIGMQAPALILIGMVHLCTAAGLPLVPVWNFLLTGVVMSSSLFCLAAFYWEHQ